MIALLDTLGFSTQRLAAACRKQGAAVRIVPLLRTGVAELRQLKPLAVIVPSGPVNDETLAAAASIASYCIGRCRYLGIGLGMLGLARAAGDGQSALSGITPGSRVDLIHDEEGLFEAVPSPMTAGIFDIRALDEDRLPSGLTISAHTLNGEIMGVRSADGSCEGIRFDPVSLLTPRGEDLIANFLEAAGLGFSRKSA